MKFEARISNFIFYLLILFLPTQLGQHFFPDFSFVSGIRVDYLAPTVYLTDIFIVCLFVFWLIEIVKSSRLAEASTKRARLKVKSYLLAYWKFAVFVFFLILGILLSKNQAVGWYGLLKLIELVFLGFYTAATIKKLRLDVILFLFSIGIIFESLLATLQYFNQGSIGGVFYFFGERTFSSLTPGIANASIKGELILRPYGTFSHPNVLAGFLVIAMTLISSKLKVKNLKFIKIVIVSSVILGTVALFLTMSRVAILVWLIILCVFLFRKFLNNKQYILFFLGGMLVLTLLTPLGARFTELKLTDESVDQRGRLIGSSFEMIKSNPVFGVGLNNFLVELPNYKSIKNYFTDLQPVHNIYLLIFSQTGIIGLAFFIWFLIKTYRILNHKSYILILLTSILTLGMFDHYFLTLQQGQLIFPFVLGIIWNKGRSNVF